MNALLSLSDSFGDKFTVVIDGQPSQYLRNSWFHWNNLIVIGIDATAVFQAQMTHVISLNMFKTLKETFIILFSKFTYINLLVLVKPLNFFVANHLKINFIEN